MTDPGAPQTRVGGISRSERRRRDTQLLRSQPYPRSAWRRWMLRAVFAAPGFVVIALGASGAIGAAAPNAALLERAAALDFGRADSVWLSELYPHISTVLAALVAPLGAAGLSLVGVVMAGFLLQSVLQILHQRAVGVPFGTALMLALAGTPLFFYLANENLPAFLAIAFFGMALADIQRFVTWGNTGSGFRAGLLLAASALSDPSGILLLAIAVFASPFLRPGRWRASGRRTSGLRAANALVLAFPALATIATLVLLNLAFFRVVWPIDLADWATATPDRVTALADVYTQTSVSSLLVVGPVITAIVVALIVRRPVAAVVAVIVFGLLNAGFVLGLVGTGAAGTTYLLMTLLAVTLMPTGRTLVQNSLLTAIAVAQLALGWAISFDRPLVREWMRAVVDTVAAALGGGAA